MRNLRFITLAILVIAVLGGCAYKDDGAINYHKTLPDAQQEGMNTSLELPLFEKYTSGEKGECLIAAGQSISIHLEQALIKEFFELGWDRNPSAEIAVIVNAFEMTGSNTFDFSREGIKKGRLVYYSDDVKKGQFLNFSYMPIYGPIKYEGHPIGLNITVMELDAGSKAIKDMISLLANAGSMAYPPASPVLKILDSLGTALVGSQDSFDDRIFQYRMVLHPTGGEEKVDYPLLETGHYVFIRHEERTAPEHWPGLTLDTKSGRLVFVDKNNLLSDQLPQDKQLLNDLYKADREEQRTIFNNEIIKINEEYDKKKFALEQQRKQDLAAQKDQAARDALRPQYQRKAHELLLWKQKATTDLKAIHREVRHSFDKQYQHDLDLLQQRNRTAEDHLYRENTYLVLQIQKGFNSTELDLRQALYGSFLPKLREAETQGLAAMEQAFKEYKGDSRRIHTVGDIRGAIDRIKGDKKLSPEAARSIGQQALTQLSNAIIQESACSDTEKKKSASCIGTLSTDEINGLLDEVRALVPLDSQSRGKVTREQLVHDGTPESLESQGNIFNSILNEAIKKQ